MHQYLSAVTVADAATGGGVALPGDVVFLLFLAVVGWFFVRRRWLKRDRLTPGRKPKSLLGRATRSDRAIFDRGDFGALVVVTGSLIAISLEALAVAPILAFFMGALAGLLAGLSETTARVLVVGAGAVGSITAITGLFTANACRGPVNSIELLVVFGLVVLTTGVAAVTFVWRSIRFRPATIPDTLNAFAAMLALILFAANYDAIEGASLPGKLPFAVIAVLLAVIVAAGIAIEPRFTAQALSVGTAIGGLVIVSAVGGVCFPQAALFAVFVGMAIGWWIVGLVAR